MHTPEFSARWQAKRLRPFSLAGGGPFTDRKSLADQICRADKRRVRRVGVRSQAGYIGSATFDVEELMRGGQLPFRIVGQRRAVEVKHLEDWIDKVPPRAGRMDSQKRSAALA